MTEFVGRSGNMLLFTEGDRGVIVDSEFGVVVASGLRNLLEPSEKWADGEYSELDSSLAASAFGAMDTHVTHPTRKMYTVPRGVQQEARKALNWMNRYERGGTDVSVITASALAAGGQVDFGKVRHISQYFARHANDKYTNSWEPDKDGTPSPSRITWGMWGGDVAQKWAMSIMSREGDKALTADGGVILPDLNSDGSDPFIDAFELDPEQGPEFLARVRMDGSGIDRLYKIDIDRSVYLWDDDHWDNLGFIDGDIYAYDATLDDPSDTVAKSHIVIDPSSAVVIGARLTSEPFSCVLIEDIDAEEAEIAKDAIPNTPWDLVDDAMVAAGTIDQANQAYSPQERSANASKQVRTSDGRFATDGQRVTIKGDATTAGAITNVDTATGNVTVQMDRGGSVTVPAKSTESEKAGTKAAMIPGNPIAIPKINLSGILAEPRTPINFKGPQLPGTLPAMTTRDLHDILYNWPSYVANQRAAFKATPNPSRPSSYSNPSNLDIGDAGRAMEKQTGVKLITDAYDNPLLAAWLRKKNSAGTHSNSIWYQPTFSAMTASATDSGTLMDPDTSDVAPIFMAIVASDDPSAVTQLIALVPASSTSNSPMVYSREDDAWKRDDRTLMDLQSATPPPVVPLDTDTLQEVLSQVDTTQEDQEEEAPTTEVTGGQVTGNTGAAPAAATPTPTDAPAAPADGAVTASVTQVLNILWGPQEGLMQYGLTAAGGPDRDRGGAEKLRHYWTRGAGAAKIRWNSPGDWTRCVRHLGKYLGPRAKGYCALRHKEMTGMWTGDKGNLSISSLMEGTFSNDDIVSSSTFYRRATNTARARFARDRISGLTAAGFETELGPVYGEMPMPEQSGSPFIIPMVLPIGVESGDGRMIATDAQVEVRELPIPLLWQINTASGHDGSVVVGRIDSMEITPEGVINARGVFDTGSYGSEAERLVRQGFLRGVSADMDKFKAQEIPVFAETDEDDEVPTIESKQVLVNATRIMAATIVAKPAFQECEILILDDAFDSEEDEMSYSLEDGYYTDEPDPIEAAAIVAAGYVADHIPVAPPKAWFTSPGLSKLTPITVTDDGHVFGHIASWGQSHIGLPGNTNPPRSRSNYAYFQTGVLRTAEGDDINVGQLTLAGGHADLTFSARDAIKHYDDTMSGIADVRAGEDAFGIWVSGALRPGTTPERVRVFRASAPSGDWRPVNGKLELVAVCQVNVPGFPVARTLVAGGQQKALVAAGAAQIARLNGDPLAEMQARLEKLEQFTTAELSAKADDARARMTQFRQDRNAELTAKRAEVISRFRDTEFGAVSPEKRKKAAGDGNALPDGSFPINNVADLKKAIQANGRAADKNKAKAHIKKRAKALGHPELIPDTWSIESTDLRARLAQFASSQDKQNREEEVERLERQVNPTKSGDADPKYTAKTQPRNDDGKFRLILARLRDNVGVNGNQEILEKIKALDGIHTGDYKAASLAYADMVNTLDKIDSGAMDPGTRGTLRKASIDLSSAVANLPLPFDDQSQKVRFSDLPPVLREMVQNLVDKVTAKYGKDSPGKLKDINTFMSGGDYFSQSDVSTQLNHLLHLLTV